jgi:hypothetical protein
MLIRIRRHDNKHQEMQEAEPEGIIAVLFAVSTAWHTDQKSVFRMSRGPI